MVRRAIEIIDSMLILSRRDIYVPDVQVCDLDSVFDASASGWSGRQKYFGGVVLLADGATDDGGTVGSECLAERVA